METDVEELPRSKDFLVTVSGIRVDLYSGDEVRALRQGGDPALVRIVDWCESFLGRPSALLGRSGNVCPFVPEAMMRGSLKFALVRFKSQGQRAKDIEELIVSCRGYFLSKESALGKIDIFGSMVMIFPEISKEEASSTIDPLQRKFKPTFVKKGLMLGEFHPLSPTPGLRSAYFRPLRSPIPLLAIRHMVESDIDFLIAPSDPPQTRVESIQAYLHVLGSSVSLERLSRAKDALKLAKAELRAKPSIDEASGQG